MEAAKPTVSADAPESGFLGRHQFLIFRLFSLAGLIPIGAYVVLHLAVNSSVLAGAAMYQNQVDKIHSLGDTAVVILEWTFIFIPIMFHALVGLWIISGGLPNTSSYPYGPNIRYTLQRATAVVVGMFIVFHIWQMHHLGRALGGGKFDAEHAASSAAVVLDPLLMKIIYTVGTLCAVYHLTNGMWTFGITWGIWTSDRAATPCRLFLRGFRRAGGDVWHGLAVRHVGSRHRQGNHRGKQHASDSRSQRGEGEVQLVVPNRRANTRRKASSAQLTQIGRSENPWIAMISGKLMIRSQCPIRDFRVIRGADEHSRLN